MSIISTDLKFYLSGGASNTDPNVSLGGVISTTEVTDDVLNNLFDDVSGAEHTAGDTEYRCFYLKNTNGIDTALATKTWIEAVAQGDDTITVGLDTAGVGASASETLANESTAPDGGTVTFSVPSSGSPLTIGDMTTGQYIAIWIKRVTASGSTPQANNSVVIKFSADTE